MIRRRCAISEFACNFQTVGILKFKGPALIAGLSNYLKCEKMLEYSVAIIFSVELFQLEFEDSSTQFDDLRVVFSFLLHNASVGCGKGYGGRVRVNHQHGA